jgi:putative peptide zinc metalloprotease protein
MAGSFLSDSWYRVGALRPQLRRHARVTRQRLRGEPWYILHDPLTNRSQRFSPKAWWLLSQLDGRCSVDEAWQRAVSELGDEAPSQDEVIGLLSQLHKADLLLTLETVPDAEELLARQRRQQRSIWLSSLLNPMSIRIPLWNPDRFLERTMFRLRPLFGLPGLCAWLALVLPALFLAAEHWNELTGNLSDRLLSSSNLLSLALVFPVVKFLHEMGHGYAVKARGGHVHEAGVMLIMFAPTPYVDASASSEFRSKWYRAFVAAAGMITELSLAALALYVWLAVEPGVVRTVAFNVMVVAGGSTLVFNGNPLLRFDGYYILSDLIEIPNLAQRANEWYGWLIRRYAFLDRDAIRPRASPAEARWFLVYAPAAFVCRVVVSVSMALFVANKYFFVGVLIAIGSAANMLLFPFLRGARYLTTSPALARCRKRAWAVTLMTVAGAALFLATAPFPSMSTTQGMVWVPEGAEVRASGSGFVRRALPLAAMRAVSRHQQLFELDDPALMANYMEQQAKVAQLKVQVVADRQDERARAYLTEQSLEREKIVLADLERRMLELVTVAPDAGRFVMAQPQDLPGRYVKRGELLGYVVGSVPRVVRAVVDQDEIGMVRSRLKRVYVKVADRIDESFPGKVMREVPGGSESLPSRALTLDGGGDLPPDPYAASGAATLAKVFQLDIALADLAQDAHVGTRVYVKFEFEPEPLLSQVRRRLRQLFLSRLHV